MAKSQAYQWEFDRSTWDSRTEASTFSVGIYQWLPSASGNSLKKSKTIRVLGYVTDPESVYAKARELCDRLNAEHARFEKLPEWVQKQYSVPKPAGFAKPQMTWLSGAEARSIRNRVAKQHLLPAGFIKSHASTFVRRVGEIVQAINFQTMTWGGQFTVNLGLHYAFTPIGGDFTRKRWLEFDYLDCSLRARIGEFLPEKRDTWFPFGNDPEQLSETFDYCIKQSIGAIDRSTATIEDPAVLLPSPSNCMAVPPFALSYPTIFFATLEMHLGRLDDAERRLIEPLHPSIEEHWRPKHRRLLEDIAVVRREGQASKRAQEILTWVSD